MLKEILIANGSIVITICYVTKDYIEAFMDMWRYIAYLLYLAHP